MAKSSRKRTPDRAPRSSAVAPLIARLALEPRTLLPGFVAAFAGAALFLSGINFPLVFGDFSALDSVKLKQALERFPGVGANWLSGTSFAVTAKVFGEAWPWHRTVNIVLHGANVLIAYAVFRRVCAMMLLPAPQRLAPGWIAAFAAACFAVHPVAVFGVAYLSAREDVLVATGLLLVLWSVLRASQEGSRPALAVAALGSIVALLSAPQAIGIAPAALFIAAVSLANNAEQGRRGLLMGVVLIVLTPCMANAAAMHWGSPGAASGSYVDAVALASLRFVAYLVLWLSPIPSWLAIDIPEPESVAPAAAIAGIGVIVVLIAASLLRRPCATLECLGLCAGTALAFICRSFSYHDSPKRSRSSIAIPRCCLSASFPS